MVSRTQAEAGLARFSPPWPFRLFGLLQPLALAQAHARATAVFGDEFNAGFFKRNSNFVGCCLPAAEPALRCF
jgi:hypothetical protein